MDKMSRKRLSLGTVFSEETEEDMMWDAYRIGTHAQKYELKKVIRNENGDIIEVDNNELWAVINQMEYDNEIIVYGDI